MIIPINASKAFREAMSYAFERYGMKGKSAEEQQAFCAAFKLGWDASKDLTLKYLDSLKKE